MVQDFWFVMWDVGFTELDEGSQNFHMRLGGYLFDLIRSGAFRHGLSLLLLICASSLIWLMFPHRSRPVVVEPSVAKTRLNISVIANRVATAHLFGTDVASAVNAEPMVSASAITIQGLFYSEDKDLAWAILEIDGKSGIFKSGDMLPDGERLAAVGISAIQVANGPALREVDMAQSFGPASGIQLQGAPDLYAQQDPFPGQRLQPAATPMLPHLRPVSLPQTNDPISQLHALRQQLIQH